MDTTISNPALNELLTLLEQIRSWITDGSDMLWGWYEMPESLRSDLEQYARQLTQGDLFCGKELHLLYAPTVVLQEHAMKESQAYIRKYSRDKRPLFAMIYGEPSKENPYWWVAVGENNRMSFVTHYGFYVCVYEDRKN